MRRRKSPAHSSTTSLPNADWVVHRHLDGHDGLGCYTYDGLTFRIVEVHRERLARLGECVDPGKRGVYAIFNPVDQKVYVGQGDLHKRFNAHDSGNLRKDFWTKGVALFMSGEENLTSDMAKSLEHWLIASVKPGWKLINGNAGHSTSLRDSSAGVMRIATEILRHHLVSPDGWFNPAGAHQTGRTEGHVAQVAPKVRRSRRNRSLSLPAKARRLIPEQDILDRGRPFYFEKSYGVVMGSVLEEGGRTGVLVRAGSAFAEAKGSLGPYNLQHREELIKDQKIDLDAQRVLRNCVFKSFSGAASFLNGCSTNGPLFFSSMNDAYFDAQAMPCGG